MMTPDQINRAWKLRAANKSYQAIGEALGVSAKQVRLTLHPVRRPARKPSHTIKAPFPNAHKVVKRFTTIPQAVQDEADRMYQARMTAHLTTGQQLLGDPMPGRSALDKRKTDVHG